MTVSHTSLVFDDFDNFESLSWDLLDVFLLCIDWGYGFGGAENHIGKCGSYHIITRAHSVSMTVHY